MNHGFKIKNIDILNENHRVDDLLDFSEDVSNFKDFLSQRKEHVIVGLIGGYGSGKSTMLYQLEKKSPDNWLVFDAWSFPNRSDLWEGFVLDVARKISKKEFEQARKKLDGRQFDGLNSLIKIVAEGANLFNQDLGFAKNFTALFKSSPVRRVFELREMLFQILEKANRDLYIVLEDVDRAGKEGAIFIEVLRQFIRNDLNLYTKHKIIFIAPIGRQVYDDSMVSCSYKKSLDYTYDFLPTPSFTPLIENVFSYPSSIISTVLFGHIDELLQYFYSQDKSIRDVKELLRKTCDRCYNLSKIENFNPDFRIILMIEVYDSLNGVYEFNKQERSVKKIQSINSDEVFYGGICGAIIENKKLEPVSTSRQLSNIPKVVFVSNGKCNIPKYWNDLFEKHNWVMLSNLYIKKSKILYQD